MLSLAPRAAVCTGWSSKHLYTASFNILQLQSPPIGVKLCDWLQLATQVAGPHVSGLPRLRNLRVVSGCRCGSRRVAASATEPTLWVSVDADIGCLSAFWEHLIKLELTAAHKHPISGLHFWTNSWWTQFVEKQLNRTKHTRVNR